MMTKSLALAALLLVGGELAAQRALSPQVRQYVAIDAPVVALTNARLIDGTGRAVRDGQTIVIEGRIIRAVGKSGEVTIPDGARILDVAGHTIIPGIVGLHDHLYYSSAAGGSMKMMLQSYPKLFLGTGITTIRTAGSSDSYQELNLKQAIDKGVLPGPRVFVSGPYLQSGTMGAMHPLNGPDDARRMVRYWAEEGVSWFKAYMQITRAELGAAIGEAHKHGVKVTGHLCSVGYAEAVALGMDNLEHGLFANYEFYKGKTPDVCPAMTGVRDSAVFADARLDNPLVRRTIDQMVKRKVSLTSTLSVFETMTPSRVKKDQRVLDALMPAAAQAVEQWYDAGSKANDAVQRDVLKKTMAFERAFFEAGGLLGAGSDPCCLHAIAGYSDQRNYELLLEAGFTPGEAIQVMTLNGARILGIAGEVGSVEAGKQADLVVLHGDPSTNPGDIRNVVHVFREGIGFDPAKLVSSVKGQIGIK